MSADPTAAPTACWIVLPPEAAAGSRANVRVWGLTAPERLRRGLVRAEASPVQLLEATEPVPAAVPGDVLVVRGDHFYDERLIRGLLDATGGVLHSGEADSPLAIAVRARGAQLPDAVRCLRGNESSVDAARRIGVPEVTPLDLAPAYNPALRKTDPPFVFEADDATVRATENRIFRSSYKGLTDLVTKWVWPLPARELTRVLARRGVRPNTITAISYVLTFAALGLFATGEFAWGLVAGWGMTFLDTVDGKLARCTLTSSRLGHVLDHGLDLVHPPFWWAAFAVGLGLSVPGVELAMWVTVVGYLSGRALEGIFMLAFDMEIFLWRPFDGFFRTIIARRNPNLLLLSVGAAFGRPDLGFFAVAAWTGASNLVHAVRLVQATSARRRGDAIHPWYDESTAAPAA